MWNNFFKRSAKKSINPAPLAWFDPKSLDTSFNELRTAVAETTLIANDISAQLKNKLHVTEQTLSTLMCVITEGIIITDSGCIIQDWNTGAEIMFGYSANEAIGQHIDLLVQGDVDKGDIRTRFDQSEYSEKGNINRIRSLKCYKKDGSEILVDISVNAVPTEFVGKYNLIAIVRDITTQHAEQTARAREQALLSTVIEAIGDVIVVRNGHGQWTMVNKAGYAAYGFQHESDFYMKTSPEIAVDFPMFTDHLAASVISDEEAWHNRRTVRFESEVVDASNQRKFFDVLKTPLFGSNKQRELLVVLARDVSSLKEKREHINVAYKALNASSDIVCITDNQGRIQFVNKMFLIKYRFVDIRDVIGQRMSIVRSSKTPLEKHKLIWDLITIGKTWEGIITNQDTTGKELTVQAAIMPIVDHTLSVQYYICVQKCID